MKGERESERGGGREVGRERERGGREGGEEREFSAPKKASNL